MRRRSRPARTSVVAAVLAGGKSLRFGRDKARAPFHGSTLLRRAVDELWTTPQVVDVVVVSPRPYPEAAAAWTRDPVPDAGPLAGIVAALRWARRRGVSGVLVRACDLPYAGPGVWTALLRARATRPVVVPVWRRSASAGSMRRPPAGSFESLASLWDVRALPELESALSGGRAAVHLTIAHLRPTEVPVRRMRTAAGPRALRNVNRPRDLATDADDRGPPRSERRSPRRSGHVPRPR